jgi:hypothetical protein
MPHRDPAEGKVTSIMELCVHGGGSSFNRDVKVIDPNSSAAMSLKSVLSECVECENSMNYQDSLGVPENDVSEVTDIFHSAESQQQRTPSGDILIGSPVGRELAPIIGSPVGRELVPVIGSPVGREMAPVIGSPVGRELAPIIGSPVGREMAPVIGSPVGREMAPVISSLVGRELAPIIGSPVGRELVPVIGSPVGRKMAPVIGSPVGREMAPIIGSPVGRELAPSSQKRSALQANLSDELPVPEKVFRKDCDVLDVESSSQRCTMKSATGLFCVPHRTHNILRARS